jgi:WhiB family redox-sensing transcriptional regulator
MSATDDYSDWWLRAACRSADPELFFPISLSGNRIAEIEKAKAVCAKCAVRSHCLSAALALSHVLGIGGGTTEGEPQRACAGKATGLRHWRLSTNPARRARQPQPRPDEALSASEDSAQMLRQILMNLFCTRLSAGRSPPGGWCGRRTREELGGGLLGGIHLHPADLVTADPEHIPPGLCSPR